MFRFTHEHPHGWRGVQGVLTSTLVSWPRIAYRNRRYQNLEMNREIASFTRALSWNMLHFASKFVIGLKNEEKKVERDD